MKHVYASDWVEVKKLLLVFTGKLQYLILEMNPGVWVQDAGWALNITLMIRNLIRLLAEARRGSGEDGCQAQATGSFKQIFTWFFQRLNENTDTFGKKCLKNNHHVNLARNCPCNL